MIISQFFYKIFRAFLVMGLLLATIMIGIGIYLQWYIIPQLPATERLKDIQLQVPLRVYTNDGKLIAEFGEQRRIPIGKDSLPPMMVNAVLAAEDSRFFEHSGVDLKGLLRAAWSYLKTGEKSQGGSTITMQVARNFLLSPEKKFERKLKEIFLALQIERELTKEEILELYLNVIFMGNRAYGVGAAAQIYYGHNLQDLTVAEYAMLAGLPKAPSANNPISNPERAMQRRNYILNRMLEFGYITPAQHAEAINAPNTAKIYATTLEADAPYIAEMVRAYMQEKYGDDFNTKGLRVFTTIDPALQSKAQTALRNALFDYDERHGYRGAIGHEKISADPNPEELNTLLSKYSIHGGMLPSIVLAVKERTLQAYNGRIGRFEITWENLAWAGRYIDDDRRGANPRSPKDIANKGDIIMVRAIKQQVNPDNTTMDEDGNEEVQAPTSDEFVTFNDPSIKWRLASVPQIEGALIALKPANGAIIALSGGFDFNQSKFNRVIQALRQPGSNFKPFIYSAALDKGFSAASIINDAPKTYQTGNITWRPENYSHKFYGPTSVRTALTHSRNMVSIRLLEEVGIDYAIDYVTKFGFKKDRIPRNLTTALGTGEVTPLELVTGYATLANGGYAVEPYFIARIEDSAGTVLYEANPPTVCYDCNTTKITEATKVFTNLPINTVTPAPVDANISSVSPEKMPRPAELVLRPQNAWIMTSMLKDVVRFGTAKRALKLNRNDIAGKTGTTNGPNDAWFSGYTPDVVTTTWVGFDQPRSLGSKETGGRAALPMWMEFMEEALKKYKERTLPKPDGLITVRIDPSTGLRATGDNPNGKMEEFSPDTVPKQYSSASQSTPDTSQGQSGNPLEQLF
ncbi:PBP1A family penicillin-binding protein [Beggiatoa leptomitoformis]|uniref:Penicillin-binding protein 1A n=2 Tax=Beggiatoa leptomitoformis TaxID=288004 RepID=A0A2N9YHS1_9GAMM|nr:PBP1A family penicillin-binding protein [Beggiatoa leptomitoformis]AUI69766.1 PBP1A family penicillin-binding protein [Beggiatoa leptomitoformis]